MNADDQRKGQAKRQRKCFPHEELTGKILEAAFNVSNTLGCGFLEKVYENALVVELQRIGLRTTQQTPIRVQYRGQTVGEYAADLVVERAVLVEVKATEQNHPLYEAQTINYLKATGLPVGLLLNFGNPKLAYRRFVLTRERADDVSDDHQQVWRPV